MPARRPNRTPGRDDPRRTLGGAGESVAARWYEARGYEVLDRNWRRDIGELDLVLRRGPTLVFCEVKTRRSVGFGAPVEAITRAKQQRIRRLAARWLSEAELRPRDVRFDAAGILIGTDGRYSVDVIEGAF